MKPHLCLVFLFSFLTLTAGMAFAQKEINRVEGFAGYSYLNLHRGLSTDDFDQSDIDAIGNRVNAHGFNGSITGNFSRYFGATFDFSWHRNSRTIPEFDDEKIRHDVTQFMGGIQIKDNSTDGPKVKPFGRILFGGARQTIQDSVPGGSASDVFKATDFAMALGGGVDIRATRRVDIRVFQFDYNPIFRRDHPQFELSGGVQNNIRLSFGIVVH